jgi:hypothetical protein
MKTIWTIYLDRFFDESVVKSGYVFSLLETAEELIRRYENCKIKPEIVIIGVGVGVAFADFLTERGVPHSVSYLRLSRCGCADIYIDRMEGV